MTAIQNSELISVLEEIAIFGGLDKQQQNRVLELMEERTFANGEVIFKRGDAACNIYVIIEGEVLLDFEQNGHPLSDIRIKPGNCFGETSLIGVQPHIATTYAAGVTRVLELSSADLYALYESDIKLFSAMILNIARESSRRLHATDELFLKHSKLKDLKKLPYLGF